MNATQTIGEDINYLKLFKRKKYLILREKSIFRKYNDIKNVAFDKREI
jgi:hypothetical protein